MKSLFPFQVAYFYKRCIHKTWDDVIRVKAHFLSLVGRPNKENIENLEVQRMFLTFVCKYF